MNHQYAVQADEGPNAMTNRSEHEKEAPTPDSDGDKNLNDYNDARSGNDRRKDFDPRSKVGRRRSNDRRWGNDS